MADFSSSNVEGIGEERARDAATGGTWKDESSLRLEEPDEQLEAMETVTIGTHSNENVSTLEDLDEQLIPGIPNEIVFEQIVPKLPLRAFHILSLVCRCWQQAIQNHEVYDARVRSHSTETLVVFNHTVDGKIHALSLYSTRDESWHQLPAFPQSRRGIPRSCLCVSLDGKLYVLGGEEEYADFDNREDYLANRCCSEVYVLDLAGQREWKQCANMPEPRYDFGCGVRDGKIYVFGGTTCCDKRAKSICGSLVYDPKANAWSSIMPMKWRRFDHHVLATGEELFVHGGQFHDPDLRDALFSEAYHPGKDEWRLLKPDGLHKTERLFTAHGKLHLMTPLGIYVQDINSDGNSWTHLHSFVFADVDPDDIGELDVRAIHAVNDELLALFEVGAFQFLNGSGFDQISQTVLLRSKGFCSGSKEIAWERTNSGLLLDHQFPPHFMCPIQL